MKPSHWLDLIDIGVRILSIVRHLLTEFWSGQGNGDQLTDGQDTCPPPPPAPAC